MSSMVQQNAQMGALKRAGEAPGVWPPTSLRVKRSMLGGRRIIGGPSTPVPRWKLYENPFYDGIAAAAAAAAQQQSANGGGRNVAVSARKLAATLWELQELPLSLASSKSQSACPCAHYRPSPTASKRSRDHLLALGDNANANSGQLNPSPQESPRHSSYNFVSDQSPADLEKESMVSLHQPTKGAAWDSAKKSSVSSSRQVAAMRSHVHRLLERRADSRLAQIASASANPASLMVLNRIRGLEEQQTVQQMPQQQQQQQLQQIPQALEVKQQVQQVNSTPSSVVAALRMEVERARSRVHELEVAQKSGRREIDALLKKMAEEKAMWRNKEQEKIRVAVQTVKQEMEEEKKVRRRVESVNRKMSRELVEANLAVAKAVNELERERKARELMEDVCDELAREIGEDKAEVEELKRESAKVREEVEEERKMLQMAEVWREERVQMKLAEARLEIEEKSAALDHLKVDLEAFLQRARKGFQRDSPEEEASFQEAEELKMQVDSLNLKDVFKRSCYYPEAAADGAASDLYEVEAPGNDISADERPDWGWGTVHNKRREASQLQGHAGELGHKLESREQVLERLRRKYSDQNGHLHHLHASNKEGTQEDSSKQWEAYTSDPQDNDRDGGSDWNSQSDGGARGDDTKEEDGSQWESASDQDIEAMQSNNSRPSTRGGRAGADELLRGPAASDAAAEAHCGGYESMSSPQTSYIINNVNINNITQQHQLHQHQQAAAELSSGDDLWKVASSSPLSRGSKVLSDDRSRGEGGSRNSLGRGMLEVSRNSHMRLAAEQGIASPSRDWRSPDRGNPHIARGIKGFIEWPKMSRENAAKGKIVDSKVEKTDRRILRQNS